MITEIEPATDGKWGEVHDHVIHDVVTQAKWELETFGAETAIRHLQGLDEMIAKKIWRSAAAADVRLMILRSLPEGSDIIIFQESKIHEPPTPQKEF